MSNNVYFGKREEDAIVQYLYDDSLNYYEKEKIYTQILHPAFLKLIENILGTYAKKYGFFKIGLSYDELSKMGLSYIFKKMHYFNPNKETKNGNKPKAYSFFGTILKHYYIRLCMNYTAKASKEISIDDKDTFINQKWQETLSYSENLLNDETWFMEMLISWYENNMDLLFISNRDMKIAYALLELMKNRDNIENYNKKYLYIQIREITGEETSKITPVINKMKTAFVHLRQNYLNSGELKSGSITI